MHTKVKKSALTLKKNPTLRDFQNYVAAMLTERGFEKESIPEAFMLLLEECGELAKAARKRTYIKSDKNSEQFHLELEAADVLIMLLSICHHCGVDLEKAFRKKEEMNKQRSWE